MFCVFFFFFKQKTAYEMVSCDWSSDVCSSDLLARREGQRLAERQAVARARAVESGEPLALEPLRHLERRPTTPGHGDETDRRLRDHLREYKRSGHACHRAGASLSSAHSRRHTEEEIP